MLYHIFYIKFSVSFLACCLMKCFLPLKKNLKVETGEYLRYTTLQVSLQSKNIYTPHTPHIFIASEFCYTKGNLSVFDNVSERATLWLCLSFLILWFYWESVRFSSNGFYGWWLFIPFVALRFVCFVGSNHNLGFRYNVFLHKNLNSTVCVIMFFLIQIHFLT